MGFFISDIRMGFFISGTVLRNWLAKKKIHKKIHRVQEAIDGLNEVLDLIAKAEKRCLDQAAAELEGASKFEGYFASSYMESKKRFDQRANYYANWRPPLLQELELMESLKKRGIEALQDKALITKTTRRSCFFFLVF